MRCPYCIGREGPEVFVILDRGMKWREYTTYQREHDRACPARNAPLGSAFGGSDMTAEITADARRERVTRGSNGRIIDNWREQL